MRLWVAVVLLCSVLRGSTQAGEVGAGVPFAKTKDDLRCDSNMIRKANHEHLRTLLEEMVNTTYFRLFRVQLDGACPLDPPGKEKPAEQCGGAGQAIGGGGIPGGFSQMLGPSSSTSLANPEKPACNVDHEVVDKFITAREKRNIELTEEECDNDGLPSFWLDLCSRLPFKDDTEQYVNLRLNPEAYTGYNGTKVWAEIYRNNCGENSEDKCKSFEERFLYRLISGLHASINLHISNAYFPPKKGVRAHWGHNLGHFASQFDNHPERFKNLQFAFVVLLRAIHRAGPVLEKFNYDGITLEEASRTRGLVKMFVASSVLSSCQDVFTAFDERLLFTESSGLSSSSDDIESGNISGLKRRFKHIFQNVSETFNCVKCQKCRLHGKLQLLGIGTAIKLLLIPENMIRDSLHREEVVALFNALDKFSESMIIHAELSEALRVSRTPQSGSAPVEGDEGAKRETLPTDGARARESVGRSEPPQLVALDLGNPAVVNELVDSSLRAVVAAAEREEVTSSQEDDLVDAVLDRHPDILLLSKHYAASRPEKFLRHALRRLPGLVRGSGQPQRGEYLPIVVVGAGLSGMSAVLSILDRGGSVILLDKEAVAGGNSAKASSGINGIDLVRSGPEFNDSVAIFKEDVLRGSSAENRANPLVDVLVEGSVDALAWLRSRTGLPLDQVGQLGGHSRKRTWRPATGLAGSEIVAGINKALKETTSHLPEERFHFFRKTKATELVVDQASGAFVGVKVQDLASGKERLIRASAVVLASGGFAYNKGGSLIHTVRPDLERFATTNGEFATGDGIKLAVAVGGDTVDLDQVQVHPTGFVDPKDRLNPIKTLAAELLRGVGAVILNSDGSRFVNELGTRKMVSETMMAHGGEDSPTAALPEFIMLLNAEMAAQAPKHIPMYEKKALLRRFDTIEALAAGMNISDPSKLTQALAAYDRSAADLNKHPDAYGRTVFPKGSMLNSPAYYAGWIQPVVHYTMGGLRIDSHARVLNKQGEPILNGAVYAVGEVTGGVHGENRLGGNALTEATVFGRRVGVEIPIHGKAESKSAPATVKAVSATTEKAPAAPSKPRSISAAELASHGFRNSCWVSLHGKVYDLTAFVDDHPGSPEAITDICGKDGTHEFAQVHSENMLVDFDPIGFGSELNLN